MYFTGQKLAAVGCAEASQTVPCFSSMPQKSSGCSKVTFSTVFTTVAHVSLRQTICWLIIWRLALVLSRESHPFQGYFQRLKNEGCLSCLEIEL